MDTGRSPPPFSNSQAPADCPPASSFTLPTHVRRPCSAHRALTGGGLRRAPGRDIPLSAGSRGGAGSALRLEVETLSAAEARGVASSSARRSSCGDARTSQAAEPRRAAGRATPACPDACPIQRSVPRDLREKPSRVRRPGWSGLSAQLGRCRHGGASCPSYGAPWPPPLATFQKRVSNSPRERPLLPLT